MNLQEIPNDVSRRIQVTRQNVTYAKKFILAHFAPQTETMEKALLDSLDMQPPQRIVIDDSVPLEPQLAKLANAIGWKFAFAEAISGLVTDGILLIPRGDFRPAEFSVDYSLGEGRYSRGSGGLELGPLFQAYNIYIPGHLSMAPTLQSLHPEPFTDPDLFLAHLEILDLNFEVQEALRQAVKCFRHELYLPAIAMLGLASEGAWQELGISLLKVAEHSSAMTQETIDKKRGILTDVSTSTRKKIDLIAELYSNNIFAEVVKKSGRSSSQLSQVLNWSNVIREGRNEIHFGEDSASENTYEKVAALLLGVPVNLNILYSIRRVAEELA